MLRIAERSIPNSGITSSSLFNWVRDVIIPVLRDVRRIVNARFGTVVDVSSDYTLGDNDEVVIADTSSGNVNVYLPPMTTSIRTVYIKCIGTNNVVIHPSTSDATAIIDNFATYTINTNYQTVGLINNGINWYIITEI